MNTSHLNELREHRLEILNNALEQNLLKSVYEFSTSYTEALIAQVSKTNLHCVHVYQKDGTLLTFQTFLVINKPADFKAEVESNGVIYHRRKQIKPHVSLDYFIKKIPNPELKEIFHSNYKLFTPEEIDLKFKNLRRCNDSQCK